jgi:hypothetical protein
MQPSGLWKMPASSHPNGSSGITSDIGKNYFTHYHPPSARTQLILSVCGSKTLRGSRLPFLVSFRNVPQHVGRME